MKALNLDALESKVLQQVVVNGRTYDVVEMSVGDFIQTMKDAESLEALHKAAKKSGDENSVANVVASLEILVRSISRAIPDLPEAEVRALPMAKLYALNDFIRGTVPEDLREQVGMEESSDPAKAEEKTQKN